MYKKKISMDKYFRADEAMKGARKVDLAAEIRARISQEQDREIVDSFTQRQLAAWSELSGKMVGAERIED
jgi:hypothetical protein